MIDIQASEEIREHIKGLRFGILTAINVRVLKTDHIFENELIQLEEDLKTSFPEGRPSTNETVGHVRRMYRRIGWEPTRYRPSSEALMRRLLKGKGLYRINNLVDYGNLASAKFHLPMGLYDRDKIAGTILVDVGRSGESYRGISNPEIHAENKMILRDDKGIFGNPTADSMRTSIHAETRHALAVFFGPPEVDERYLQETITHLQNYYKPFCEDSVTDLIRF